MTQRIKTIISVVVFIALLIGAIFACSSFLEQKQGFIEYEDFFEAKTNHDVIFLGTSHMYNSILPMELWQEYGIASYNWGYSNCTPAENYYLIQEILKYTAPKLLVLDLYGLIEYESFENGKYHTDRIEQQHVQFDEIPISLNKLRAAKDVFDNYDGNLDFLWNFAIFHHRWSELKEIDFTYEPSTQKGGSLLLGWKKCYFNPISQEEQAELDTVCFSYFLQILEYCEQNDIQLLCVYLPYGAPAAQQQVSNSVETIINGYEGCSYVNMLYEDIIDYSLDQYDYSHLNYFGACKATSWLGQYLVDHYELDDYSQNEHWIRDYEAYLQYKETLFEEQTSLVSHLIALWRTPYQGELEIFDETLANTSAIQEIAQKVSANVTVNIQKVPYAARLVIQDGEDVIIDRLFYDYNSDGYDLMNVEIELELPEDGSSIARR